MKFLAIDSSAKTASVAVGDNGKLLGEYFIDVGLTHSQTLMSMVEYLFLCTGMDISDTDLFAVTSGPGSFTGVRIGVSAVKGMAFALDKKCISVSTLHALAYNVIDKDCIICCCMDARRGQVYNAIFESNGSTVKRLVDDRAISVEDLSKELSNYSKEVNFVGDGAEMCYNVTRQKFTNLKLHLTHENLRYTKASSVLLAAESMYSNGEILNAGDLVPTYLRLSQAERELKKKNNLKDGDDICI